MKLVKFFHEVLLDFDRDEQKVISSKVFDHQKKFQALREKEWKFGQKVFIFESALVTDQTEKSIDIMKQCFWLNIVNYACLSRFLELILVDRKKLKDFNDVVMFVHFIRSTKITIMNYEITVSEIMTSMLSQTDLSWLESPYEQEGNR